MFRLKEEIKSIEFAERIPNVSKFFSKSFKFFGFV